MKIVIGKQPQKYLKKVPEANRKRLNAAIDSLPEGKGDIKKIAGSKNKYRLKMPPYRILFTADKANNTITITTINTRTNIKY